MRVNLRMLGWFKKKQKEERLEPADIQEVSPLLLPPELPQEEKLAYHPENTVLDEDLAMSNSTASGAGTSGGFGAFQPFLSQEERERREHPEAWEHDEAPDTNAPQQPIDPDDIERIRKETGYSPPVRETPKKWAC